MSYPIYRCAIGRFLVPAVAVVLAGSLPGLAFAEWMDLGGESVTVNVLESDGSRSVIEVTVGGFEAKPVEIDGKKYYSILLPKEGREESVGYPGLPNVRRSLIIPDDRQMAVRVLDSDFVEYPDLPVAPSKGHLLRTVDPAMVPYTFDSFYDGNGIFPATAVEADDPYILRDYRGMVVDANVFQYSPANATLRVYTRMVIEVTPVGPGLVNVFQRSGSPQKLDPQFALLYQNHFLNFGGLRYNPVLENGGLLIITYDAFEPYIQPLAEWKNQKGIETRVATLSQTGSSYSQIASYIAGEYQNWNLAYVLLIGDQAQLPKYGTDSDPVYGLITGSDNYPEVFVGRFSAENPDHVLTQVERTIHYERDVGTGSAWAQGGTGVASNQGPGHYGEYDDEHEDLIRQDLLGYGYTQVDQIYDPSGTATMVSNALNAGRGIVNYTGHGSTTSWGSTGFSNSHVNALVNDNMLPFICSVACNNGTFTSTTCFAEAWQRATHNGLPTGAIASYMSYISQSWDPPMYAQDEAVDLLVSDQMRTIGGLWFNGSCHMMDMAGSTGQTEFRNWTIFGDPSVAVRTKMAQTMTVNHGGVLMIGMTQFELDVPGVEGALCALYADGVLYGTGTTDAGGHAVIALAEAPGAPMTLTLTVTAYNKVTVQEDIQVLPPEGPHLVFESVVVLDDDGDADGILDECENVGLSLTLENVGVEVATNVSAVLTSADPYLNVVLGGSDFPDIPAGGMGTCYVPCNVSVAGSVPDEHLISFSLQVTADGGEWGAGFSLNAQAPVLAAASLLVDDTESGNGDGGANAGETFDLFIKLANAGHSDAEDFEGLLSSTEQDVVVHRSSASCEWVPVGGEAYIGQYEIQILPSCPEPANLAFHLQLTNEAGYAADIDFEVPVGGWLDDMESPRGWTVGASGDNATSGIWVRADPVGTEYNGFVVQMEDDHTADPATLCFVTGNGSPGGTAGAADVDGGQTTLLSPVFDLDGALSAQVSYYRWYTNDAGNNPGEDWWDVAVTNNGLDWVTLEHTQASDASWTQYSFELTEYVALTGHVQIRFVASDVGVGGSLVEAGVDDFVLMAIKPVVSGIDDPGEGLPQILALRKNFPNPFNPKTTVSFDLPRTGPVELAVYDLNGRRIATLVSEVLEAGNHEVAWFGRDQEGRAVASGLYITRLESGGEVLTNKMVLLK